MMLLPPPLRFTLPGLLLVVGLLLQGLLLHAQLDASREHVIETAAADTRVMAALAAAELGSRLRAKNRDLDRIHAHLTHISAHPEIRSATLLDETGRIVSSTEIVLADWGGRLSPPTRHRLASAVQRGTETTVHDGNSLLGIARVPFPKSHSFGGHEQGSLVIERSLRKRLATAQALTLRYAAIQGGGVLAAVLLLYLALRWLMLRRLDRVRATARRIAEGDHEARAGLGGADEIATLGCDLDLMAARLAERAALERAFNESQKFESLGRLTGGVAHDFNNLLAAANLSAGILHDSLPGDHPDQELLDDIENVCRRGGELTRQLLQFARQDTSAKRPFDLASSLSDLAKIMERLLPDGIRLHIQKEVDNAWIDGSRSSIEQCMINLVVNARDAMPEGGRISVELRHELVGEERFVAIAVRDAGHGIPEEFREKIFEPFFTTKQPGKGTGLGLASMFGIVKQHGGELQLESEVGAGSTFTILLPIHQGVVASGPPPSPPRGMATTASVLIVEDDPGVRRALARSMRDRGLSVREVASGQEALQVFHDQPKAFEIVVSDLGLPDMTGLRVHQELQGASGDLPFILISGHADEQGAKSEIERRGIPLLEKPFSPGELVSKILSQLDPKGEE